MSDSQERERIRAEHWNGLVPMGQFHQALCTCGWMSLIGEKEEVDLLRAMHAHAVVTFGAYA